MKKKPFLWGVATSAYQIEGGIENDILDWEKQGHFRLNGKNPKIGLATDHWNRWKDDFKLLKELGVNSYRMSVEWARLEPEPGQFNRSAIEQYHRMIEWLLEAGIAPMVTLHHFTHPPWFHNRSPWHDRRSIESFLRFVEKIGPKLLRDVPYIVTLNEPLVWLLAAYADAKFPPGETQNWHHLMTGLHHMLEGHCEAYDFLKTINGDARIGIAHNFIVFKRAPQGMRIDRNIKRLIHRFYNRMVIEAFESNRLSAKFPLVFYYSEPIRLDNKIDFWGVNYYYRLHVRFRFNMKQPFELLAVSRSSGEGQSDLGWEIYPRGLYKVCHWLKSTDKPVIITENGIPSKDDDRRVQFLHSHLDMLEKSRAENPNICGYFHWSLLDNYEWLEGTDARFGLYHVDFANDLAREPKPSSSVYRDFIESHQDWT